MCNIVAFRFICRNIMYYAPVKCNLNGYTLLLVGDGRFPHSYLEIRRGICAQVREKKKWIK